MNEPKTRKEIYLDLNKKATKYSFSVTELKFSARYLRGYNFDVKTVFDVGVHSGTPALYKAFSDRKLVLFDPIPAAKKHVEQRFPDLLPDFHNVALGATPGVAKMSILGAASTLKSHPDNAHEKDARFEGEIDVKIDTLDNIVAENQYEGPYGLKIDAEGYEIEVLKGATETLTKTEFVITETCVRKRFENSYEPSELIGLLAGCGFEILNMLNDRPGYQQYYDMLFVRRDHPARTY